MLRGRRGSKRGRYSSYEFKDQRCVLPRSTAYAASHPRPLKKSRIQAECSQIEDRVLEPSSTLTQSTNILGDGSVDSNAEDISSFSSNQIGDPVVQPTSAAQFMSSPGCGAAGPIDSTEDTSSLSCDRFDDSFEDEGDCFDEEEDSWASSIFEDTQPLPPPPPPEDPDSDEELVLAYDVSLTVAERIKVLLLLAAKARHKLTYAATECLLKLAGVWSQDTPFVPSKFILKSTICKYSSSLNEHHMCPHCDHYVGPILEESLDCPICSTQVNAKLNKKQGNVFLYVSLTEQIKSLLVHGGLFHELINPQNRQRIQEGTYEDIMDGKFYKSRVLPGSISFNFFVDGFQARSTNRRSAWPVLISLNELPLHLRRKHIMMACVWLGKKNLS